MAPLQVGHGRRCITPPLGTSMMGYGPRTEGARDIHDELFVNAVALEADGRRAAILAYDLCFFGLPLVERTKAAVRDAAGLEPEQVLLNTSHTHAGPAVGHWHGQQPDAAYEQSLLAASAGAAADALEDLSQAALSVGTGRLDIGCNRRERRADGAIVLGVNPDGPTLPELTAWRLARPTGPDVVVFSVPMHGTTMGGENLSISAEWMGLAVARYEADHSDARAVFLAGCGADQNPYRDPGGFGQMGEHAQSTAAALSDALARAADVDALPLRTVLRPVPLPLQGAEGGTWPLPLHGLRLGDAVLIGLGCEPFVEFASFGKGLTPPVLVVGYTDGSVGYLPTADAYEHGGYETIANGNFNVGRPFVPEAESIVKDAMREILAELSA